MCILYIHVLVVHVLSQPLWYDCFNYCIYCYCLQLCNCGLFLLYRAAIEEQYAKSLLKLSKSTLADNEEG